MKNLQEIYAAIMADEQNQSYTKRGIEPLFAAPQTARIVIIGQAPGIKAEQSRLYWNDPSGVRLRSWLGVDEETFYHSGLFAVLPMDFYYPGKGKSGDLPPRKGFAEKWHASILEGLADVKLTLLIGSYAQQYYLGSSVKKNLTATVQAYQEYLPDYFPLVHPSPRNQIWQAKNPWFQDQVIPDLQGYISAILKEREK